MYSLHFTNSAKKELKRIDRHHQVFIVHSLDEFISNFSDDYEAMLISKGKIKRLQGQKEILYRLRLRSYRVIYKKYADTLVILVLNISTREGAY